MKPTDSFARVLKAMEDPGFYPHGVQHITQRETHISVVFLTGPFAYKLKKPKDLGFLDFRSLADRKEACNREVALNQRLSSGIYLEVVPVHEDGKSLFTLAPVGRIVEYAVKMVQLPEDANLVALLGQDRVLPDDVESLGGVLSDFYSRAERSSEIDVFGAPEAIQGNMEENFTQIQPFAEKWLAPDKWDFIRQVCRSFLAHHRDLFFHRIETGRICDGHGDLRCDHVYFQNGIQVIDCIEFNDRFRYGDSALDLSFLIMDLDHLGYSNIGHLLVSVYAEKTKDPEVYALLDFYAAYRALVRLKVTCFSFDHLNPRDREPAMAEIRRYLNQAYQYSILFGRPMLWIFCGLPASGKSTLAGKVTEALFIPLFQSDRVRKEDENQPLPKVSPFNTGAYRPILKGRVYAKLLNLALEQLKQGRSVALDATFSEAKWREAAIQLAQDLDAGLIFVQCICSHQTLEGRLKQREIRSGDSDARLIHLEDILKNTEPFVLKNPDTHLIVDTDQPVEDAFHQILSKARTLKYARVETLSFP